MINPLRKLIMVIECILKDDWIEREVRKGAKFIKIWNTNRQIIVDSSSEAVYETKDTTTMKAILINYLINAASDFLTISRF